VLFKWPWARSVWQNCRVTELEGATASTEGRVLALLQRFGREATSFQILEPGLTYWFFDDLAVVAYTDLGSAWVAAGEPVCEPARTAEIVARFRSAAEQAGRRVRFFHVSHEFTERAGLAYTHVGELPTWDPSAWQATLQGAKSLREQLRRARNKGVTTRVVDGAEIGDPSSPLRLRCDALVRRWLGNKGMGELKFMVRVHPYGFPRERRYVVAERDDRLLGLAIAIPVYQRQGWFIEDLLRDDGAPNGTAELLVDTLMRQFASEGSRYATLGLAPLAGEVRPLLALTRNYTTRLYNFPGVRSFKEKLRPRQWDPVYLAYPRGEFGVLAMRDVLAAFTPDGLVRFGLETLVHQRTLATLVLALLLVPWTLALLLIDTATWFPGAGVQYAWAGFDLLLIGLMLSLARRWRARVAELVVLLTTLDALLTTVQVLLWNVWTARTLAAWALVVLGCAGPLLAATFFWSTRVVAMRGRRMRT
jgi:phosphatidylglycerol lysyltransferase